MKWNFVWWIAAWFIGLTLGIFLPVAALGWLFLVCLLNLFILLILWRKSKNLLPQLPLLTLFFFTAWFYSSNDLYSYDYIKKALFAPKKVKYTGMVFQHEQSENQQGEKILLTLVKATPPLPGGRKVKLLVYTRPGFPPVTSGHYYEFTGKISYPTPPLNPGQFNYPAYLKQKGIHGILYTVTIKPLPVTQRYNLYGLWLSWGETARKKLMTVGNKVLGEEKGGFLHSFLYGTKSFLTQDLIKAYQDTGVIHILVVSGMQVSFIVLLALFLLEPFHLPDAIKFPLAALFILFYIAIVNANPPVLRSAVMTFLTLGGWKNRSDKAGLYYLLISAFALSLFSPRIIIDVSFLLSVSALAGILIFTSLFGKPISFIPESLFRLITASLGAQLGVLPWLMFYFGQIPWIGILLNLFTIPISMLLVLAGIAGETVGLIFFFLGKPLLLSAGLLVDILNCVVFNVGLWPWGRIIVPSSNVVYLVLAWLLVFSFRAWLAKNRLTGRRLLPSCYFSTMILAVFGCLAWQAWFWSSRPILKIAFLAVGQGNSAVIQTPRKQILILDTGKTGYELQSYLASNAKRKTEGLIITHNHLDHAGGAEMFVKYYKPSFFWSNDTSLQREYWRKYRVKSLPATRNRWTVEPDLVIEVYTDKTGYGKNGTSLIFMLRYKKVSILCTGDLEETGWEEIADRLQKCTVFQVPHHGAENEMLEKILAKTVPKYAIISVGPNNYGHPSPRTLQTLVTNRIKVYRTDKDGCVFLTTDGEHLQIWTYIKGAT